MAMMVKATMATTLAKMMAKAKMTVRTNVAMKRTKIFIFTK